MSKSTVSVSPSFSATPRDSRALAANNGDDESEGLLTIVITEFEKNAWFLRATLA